MLRRFFPVLMGLMTAGAAAICCAADSAAPWPFWLGPNHDGKSVDTGLLKQWPAGGPKLLWQADGIGPGYSSVAVGADAVYVDGDAGGNFTLFAYDLAGKSLWSSVLGKSWNGDHAGARSSPVLDAGNVYVISGDGAILCSSAKTGEKKWSHTMKEFGGSPGGWGYAESVLIDGDLAIVTPGGAKCVVALNKTTGQAVWASAGFKAGANYSSAIDFTFEGNHEIVQGTVGGLLSVNPANGAVLWSNNFSAGNVANCPSPAYADGYVFWANGYGKGGICMKLSADGKAAKAWTTRDMDCHHGGYIIDKGYIYGNNGGGWACLDLKTGEKKWSDAGVGKGSLCYADGMLYLFSENGGVCGLANCSPEKLQMTGKLTVKGNGPSWAHPVVAGGKLYLRYDTHLYCFDVKAP